MKACQASETKLSQDERETLECYVGLKDWRSTDRRGEIIAQLREWLDDGLRRQLARCSWQGEERAEVLTMGRVKAEGFGAALNRAATFG